MFKLCMDLDKDASGQVCFEMPAQFDWSKASAPAVVLTIQPPSAQGSAGTGLVREGAQQRAKPKPMRVKSATAAAAKRVTRRAAPPPPDDGSASPSSTSSHSSSDLSSSGPPRSENKIPLSPRSKKERRRARNRELAAQSRDRRKLEFDALKRENEDLRAKLARFECTNPKAMGAAGVASFVALCADSADESSLSSSAAVLVAYADSVFSLDAFSQLAAVMGVMGLFALVCLVALVRSAPNRSALLLNFKPDVKRGLDVHLGAW
jgi:hypothetical protein